MIQNKVRQDNTWLVVDPIVGCQHDCQYCFLQLYKGKTKCKGEVVMSPEEAINELTTYWAFCPTSMVMIGSETDMFMNSQNIDFLYKFIELYDKKGIVNPLSLATKCYIPDEFITFVKSLKNTKIIFYISYSGLGSDIEPYIKKDKVKTNFIRLNEASQHVIHLWRPMTPQNSTYETLEKVLNDVKGATCSVMRGLNLNPELQKKVWFWAEARDKVIDFEKNVSAWPEVLDNNIKDLMKIFPDYPLFFKNSCAMAYVLKQPEFIRIYDTERCNKSYCPIPQREICEKRFSDTTSISQSLVKEKLSKLNLTNDFTINSDHSINIMGTLNHEQVACLAQMLHCRLIVEKIITNHEWGGYVLGHEDIII